MEFWSKTFLKQGELMEIPLAEIKPLLKGKKGNDWKELRVNMEFAILAYIILLIILYISVSLIWQSLCLKRDWTKKIKKENLAT